LILVEWHQIMLAEVVLHGAQKIFPLVTQVPRKAVLSV
jgi:hypothetical protein